MKPRASTANSLSPSDIIISLSGMKIGRRTRILFLTLILVLVPWLAWRAPTLTLLPVLSVLAMLWLQFRDDLYRDELCKKNASLLVNPAYNQQRLTELNEAMRSIGMLDFKPPLTVGSRGDLFDELASSLNALREELQSNAISRAQFETMVALRTSQLESVNAELSSFAYIASHDLKAPLRAISQLSSWIAADYTDVLDEQGREMLSLLVERTRHMHRLIDGILQYSRIGRATETSQRVNVATVVNQVIDALAPPPTISIFIEDGLPVVTCDATLLTQVFQNLLSNAIRYNHNEHGHITISSRSTPIAWRFSVTDNGPGIEARYFEKIFQLFQTLGTNNESDSTGIGLALVKKIVEKWGGEVWVESELGRGSSFQFTMPKKTGADHGYKKADPFGGG